VPCSIYIFTYLFMSFFGLHFSLTRLLSFFVIISTVPFGRRTVELRYLFSNILKLQMAIMYGERLILTV